MTANYIITPQNIFTLSFIDIFICFLLFYSNYSFVWMRGDLNTNAPSLSISLNVPLPARYYALCVSLFLSICLSVSVCLSLSVCHCFSVCLFLSISLCVCLSVPFSVCHSVSLCHSISVSLSR